jgi:uncharacterized protein (TIGR02246 family)
MEREGEAVRALYQELLDGWNQRSAEGMSGLLLDDAIVVGFDGSQMQGAAAVREELSRIFADHTPARYVAIVRSVRILAADVAVLHAVAGMVPPGKREIKPENNAVQTLTAVKRDGRWRIAVYQNTPARFDGRPELAAELTSELDRALGARASEEIGKRK